MPQIVNYSNSPWYTKALRAMKEIDAEEEPPSRNVRSHLAPAESAASSDHRTILQKIMDEVGDSTFTQLVTDVRTNASTTKTAAEIVRDIVRNITSCQDVKRRHQQAHDFLEAAGILEIKLIKLPDGDFYLNSPNGIIDSRTFFANDNVTIHLLS